MAIEYRIPYSVFSEYFDKEDTGSIKANLFVNKTLLFLRKNPGWSMVLLALVPVIIVILVMKVLANALLWLLSSVISAIAVKINTPSIPLLSLTQNEVMSTLIIVFVVFILFFMLVSRLTAEWPFILRDLVNDYRVIRKNFGPNAKPFETNRFCILAAAKVHDDIRGFHKYIPGITKPGSLSEAKQKLRGLKVGDSSLLTNDDKYTPWTFVIEGPDSLSAVEKKKIEELLQVLWEHYLSIEARRLERRMSVHKKTASTATKRLA